MVRGSVQMRGLIPGSSTGTRMTFGRTVMAGLVPAILACDRLQKIISSVLVLSLTDYKPNDRNSAPCLVKEGKLYFLLFLCVGHRLISS
jgi:hypothetical protein